MYNQYWAWAGPGGPVNWLGGPGRAGKQNSLGRAGLSKYWATLGRAGPWKMARFRGLIWIDRYWYRNEHHKLETGNSSIEDHSICHLPRGLNVLIEVSHSNIMLKRLKGYENIFGKTKCQICEIMGNCRRSTFICGFSRSTKRWKCVVGLFIRWKIKVVSTFFYWSKRVM